jgi:hypothetical protein
MISTPAIQYISDRQSGQPISVIIPMELWQRLQSIQVTTTLPTQATGNAWEVLDALTGTLEAPSDWSSQHDHYLYGSPKIPEDLVE